MKSTLPLLLLAPVLSFAQVTDNLITCLPNSSLQYGVVEAQAWATWQCRPPAGQAQMYWDRAKVVVTGSDPKYLPIVKAALAGDATALQLGSSLRTADVSSVQFSPGYTAIIRAAHTQQPIASRISTTSKRTCVCTTRDVSSDYLWNCYTAAGARLDPTHKEACVAQ